jgi:hypothetical protein
MNTCTQRSLGQMEARVLVELRPSHSCRVFGFLDLGQDHIYGPRPEYLLPTVLNSNKSEK